MKIVLYQPDIAGNLGSAMRLCACFNVALEVIEPCGFPLTAKALRRSAMDYGTPESLVRHESWEMFKEHRVQSRSSSRLVLFTTKAETSLPYFTFKPDDALLFGQESAGVPEAVHDFSDARVVIPIHKDARSLNLANSASIALFQALRQTDGLP